MYVIEKCRISLFPLGYMTHFLLSATVTSIISIFPSKLRRRGGKNSNLGKVCGLSDASLGVLLPAYRDSML